MLLSKVLKKKRQERGETQQQVADMLHISRQSISNWENNKSYPDVPTLIELSQYFDFSLDVLKGDDDLMKKIKKDYEFIHKEKENKKYQLYLMVILLLMFIPILFIPLFGKHVMVVKYIGIFVVLMSICLLYFSLKLVQTYYKDVADKNGPLFIPKAFGIWITINPFNFWGKVIWLSLIAFLVVLVIKMILTPI
ncbi:helix-turn-helix domain-containing protein [Melissococcus plutonius]|uniref:Transcriptional regulator, XRE family n=1 Tax=Melissococcus plutonius (strain ATCC 35311 / DSM 29964 / CIP 104052 / LMG 20360 / NCIMB 702443) TaxID=940190 RepID=F3Y7T5_MELPT|nr:helix-turn-helix transcriptional regulator [Melissococcus plutonius]AIM25442.1 transcriptional regulator, XRE family [Melissococcus plutonius S1]KMT25722.1 transcriptional regulator, XRE family [Melissococcus plutonius]KMT27067.1 transcriptional regulator, XRE family [Melissococcus plutonius]KMT28443.1 transcriptional regulator, XRE family [Melissococcus plutonius]KMT29905.1 transcriptional regulator, XRE family [Melissococcus plutonius]